MDRTKRSRKWVGGAIALAMTLVLGCGDDFNPPAKADAGASGGASGSSAGTGGSSAAGGNGAGASASGGASAAGGVGGKEANGATCETSSQCASGFCVDGVCCETACDGQCMTCAGAGSAGLCTPHPVDLDPDGECAPATCSGGVKSTHACDGVGSCVEKTENCAPYACSTGVDCLSSCATSSECAPTAYCSAPVCQDKKANGQACTAGEQCQSGHCVGGSCCNVASCGTNFSCSTGSCTCNGDTCAAGDSCVDWWQDNDKDGFGNPALKSLGCSSTGPKTGTWVKNSSDCYDSNSLAKPGQTQFFTAHRGDNSWDYNCDKATTKQYPNISSLTCGICISKLGDLCSTLYTCGFGCNGTCGSQGPVEGFSGDVACGQSATAQKCAAYAPQWGGCGSQSSSGAKPQGCR